MRWHFYDSVTGLFVDRVYEGVAGERLTINTPEGSKPLAGDYDHATQRVNVTTGEVETLSEPIVKAVNPLVENAESRARASMLEARNLRAMREAILETYKGMADDLVPESIKRLRDAEKVITDLNIRNAPVT